MVMHFKSCCCGCSLKKGTVIIGILCGITSTCALIGCILASSKSTGELQDELVKDLENKRDSLSPAEYDQELRELKEPLQYIIFRVIYICLAVIYAIHVIFDILMVFGACTERPRMIKQWIVFATMSLVVLSTINLLKIIFYFVAATATSGMVVLVMLALEIAFKVYFILVVNSFHTRLLSNNFENKI